MRNFEQLLATPIDTVSLNKRASKFAGRSIKKEAKLCALDQVTRMIDLTTLEGNDTDKRVIRLCQKALVPGGSCPPVAAVCVYPNFVKTAKEALSGTNVKVASVATAFPAGQVAFPIRLEDLKQAVQGGADEIDMVIKRGAWLSGDENSVIDEIKAFKEACGAAHLKVILETGELGTYDNVRRASLLAMVAGADFVKTSTGKIPSAASLPVTLVMLEAVRDYYDLTGIKIGVKPAGGIKTAKEAIAYLVMVLETMGDDWVSPDLFRFGASSLLNDVVRQKAKQESGAYQNDDYLTIA